MSNPFVHVELATGDVPQARAFYSMVFDWTLSDGALGPGRAYTTIGVGGGTGGGMIERPGAPPMWLPYVLVASVDATIARAKAAGATIVVGRQEIPMLGVLGIFLDPAGAALGVWEPTKKPATRKPAAKKPAAKKPAAKKPAVKKKPTRR